jgi:GT2 family glycosyltransferase
VPESDVRDQAPGAASGTRHPHVAVVVLSWNGRDETLACLESVGRSDWPKMTTIVVDNGSDQRIEPAVAERFPDTIVVRNETNLGFAGGMNTGTRKALELEADYVLLLNNDTDVDKAMIRKLVEAAQQHPDAGIISPLDFFRDSPDTISMIGLRFDPRRGYQGAPLGRGERDTGQFHGVREVDASAGTAMLVPLPVVREVGLLDEDLFFYIEDIDWALRMRRAGKRIYAALEARLWHAQAASSGGEGSPRVTYYTTRNTFVVTARYAPMRRPRAAIRQLEILSANLVHALRSPDRRDQMRAVWAGWRDYRRGRLGPGPMG